MRRHVTTSAWNKFRDGDHREAPMWELYHENSKISRFDSRISEEAVVAQMSRLSETLYFPGYPHIPLPPWSPATLTMSVGEAVQMRRSSRESGDNPISIGQISSILAAAYGVTRGPDPATSRSQRSVPSAGALYPLEMFVSLDRSDTGLSGLFHYNSILHELTQIRSDSQRELLADCLTQPELCSAFPMFVFITAIFERSIFKYADRGYRFSLIEAGHVGQNISMACTSLDLGSLNIGGFFDREMDKYLNLDGITQSTIYVAGVGTK